MHIGIDVFCGFDALHIPPVSGLMAYTQRLVRALCQVADKEDKFHLFQAEGATVLDDPRVQMHLLPVDASFIKTGERHYFAEIALPDKLDCFHGPVFTLPPRLDCPSVITIHDIYYEIDPTDYCPERVRFLKDQVTQSAYIAKRIITVSHAAKADILKFVNIPPEKVEVIYLAPGEAFKPVRDPLQLIAIKKRYGIESEFLLWVGSPRKRKNVSSLLKAFSCLKRRYRIPHQLVLIGLRILPTQVPFLLWKFGIHLGEAVILDRVVPTDDLVVLYNAADVFIFPTLYEGFGLAVIEAMACGTPVVTSNLSALIEVAGDAALFVDPHDPEGIAEAICQVLSDKGLREKLRNKGIRRSTEFSWETTAKRTLDVYRSICHE